MSNLDPTGPSQPSLDTVYNVAGNPTSKEPVESRNAQTSSPNDPEIDRRVPQQQSTSQADATPTSMARGIRGAGAGEEAQGYSEEDVGRHRELDAEQMGAPGEGRTYEAVAGSGTGGRTGGQQGLESDLDKKKAEQAPMREAIQQQRSANVDVGGVLGQTGGPANPVDKDGYPNATD
ncbi:MAG: hypothetical protein M1820_010588 [Bogoriella megaspora]|nr:MAG: hypothetical protein M1820_010588 [Bogoriella megaspora]